jgi:salicylate hydroxylase
MTDQPILVAGGGIGGLTAALSLARNGIPVRVLEQTAELGAIGYGIQLGPNVFPMFEKLGLTAAMLKVAVVPRACVMFDALTGAELTHIPGEATLRARFGAPYIVIHRVDLHGVLLEACKATPGIALESNVTVTGYAEDGDGVTVTTADGGKISGAGLVGADGLRSVIRAQMLNDGDPKPIGYVAHRTIIPMEQVPAGVQRDVSAIWIGPSFHLVHYPVRHDTLCNIVAVFRTGTFDEKGDAAFHAAEVERTYAQAHPTIKAMLDKMDLSRRWVISDRDPVRRWSDGRVVILGDAAHPALQTFAQGACMAFEDGVCLGELVARAVGDIAGAFAALVKARGVRTARVQLEGRMMWEGYHAEDVARDVWLDMFSSRSEREVCDCLAWLYDGFDLSQASAARRA